MCIQDSCDPSHLGNGICDPVCESLYCGSDVGDCGYCSEEFTVDLLLNNVCDAVCDNLACMYDNYACGWCTDGCFLENLNSDTCIPECNATVCESYGNNPCFTECSPELCLKSNSRVLHKLLQASSNIQSRQWIYSMLRSISIYSFIC